jgi:hypothetical protein
MKKYCEDCKYYHFIDSAYGKCLRFPPSWLNKPKGIIQFYTYCKYPEVTFDCEICGEFSEKT